MAPPFLLLLVAVVGELYAHFDIQTIVLWSLAGFEIGPLVCAAAPVSTYMIVGIAGAGLGATGISTGALLVSFH